MADALYVMACPGCGETLTASLLDEAGQATDEHAARNAEGTEEWLLAHLAESRSCIMHYTNALPFVIVVGDAARGTALDFFERP